MTLQLSQGMSLIEIYWLNNDSDKAKCLSMLNTELDTRYNVNHLNNWLAKRKPTPEGVRKICRLSILTDFFGSDGAALHEILYS